MSASDFFGWAVPLSTGVTILGVLFGPVFLIALCERRLVWPYVAAGEYDGDPPRQTQAAESAGRALVGHGFAHQGAYYHGKAGGYRVRYDFWVSADGAVVAVVVGGRLFGIPLNGVGLLSRPAGDRYLVTINTDLLSEYDPTGERREVLVPNAGEGPLLARHEQRLAEAGAAVRFGDDPLAELAGSERRRVGRLVAGGYAGYLDDEETWWRFTVKGAVVMSAMMVGIAVRRMMRKD